MKRRQVVFAAAALGLGADAVAKAAHAKPRPGQLNFAIGGVGSPLRPGAFKLRAGVFIVNVPYRGTPVGNTPAEFAAFMKADTARWAQRVRYSGATPD